jgi:hypothetical protein
VACKVLAALADNAKHNQTGRVDENGALRHRDVEVCPVGALAALFFAHFHILSLPPPKFEPDFSDNTFGEFGQREWYGNYVFWAKDPTTKMSYDSMRFSQSQHMCTTNPDFSHRPP